MVYGLAGWMASSCACCMVFWRGLLDGFWVGLQDDLWLGLLDYFSMLARWILAVPA
jgi:hypothetical protein